MRRAAHDLLNKEACARHLPIQRAEANLFMHDLLRDPQVKSFDIPRLCGQQLR